MKNKSYRLGNKKEVIENLIGEDNPDTFLISEINLSEDEILNSTEQNISLNAFFCRKFVGGGGVAIFINIHLPLRCQIDRNR